ncbi:MAG: protein kinase [Paludisphaera borealis]|uniref:serine/threonine-protein kinase n=1 Tax=Paludisphaera borealis TaxID=1387353 RepID=UPI00283ABD9C|nr:protein kinase [Paludisphaera borealis]MDR3622384.1 protein kinase [Paludisphaera borealis]
MSEREPTSEQPTRTAGRVACSACLRVLEYSGDRPRFCAYCGVPLEKTEEDGSTIAADAPDRTRTYLGAGQTATYASGGSAGQAAQPEEFPERIADYRLVRRLGSGGMGTVFEAIDERQGQKVALKLIARNYVASDEALQRFRQEGKTASAVTHPRCVFVLAVDEDQGRPYLVMELMPGTTLQSLVDQKGALDPTSALVKIFDVIEGLEEFHKLGMIHRDVKPSNCFLDAEGRVKIGDFGLSKSLEGGLDLTRTGAFLGTPLYASPEQIKRDALDQQTDVYSVAATLYFLLTKRPPVKTDDAAEALARIVSEPAPLVRTFAPDVPRALEAVIHKGLERDRARRWRNLQEFHNALLPFVPERLGIGAFGLRIGAQLFDLLLFYLGDWAMFAVGMLYFRGRFFETFEFFESWGAAIAWAWRIAWIAYFALAEGLFGASLGKWLAGLRVVRGGVGGGAPPGLGRGIVRILCFYVFIGLGGDVLTELFALDPHAGGGVWYWVGLILVKVLGMLALLATMRRRSGFRGPHEWLSGTRVVQVVRGRRSRSLMRRSRIAARKSAQTARQPLLGEVAQVGPYRVHGAVLSAPQGKVLLGQDSTLDRQVWILLRPPTASPPGPPRRALNRLTRPRWIGGGDQPEGRWDAFTAPSGLPLGELVQTGGLPWADVLSLLTDLAEEVEAARGDGTFPPRLSVEHVWIQDDGRVQIIDPLDWDDAPDREAAAEAAPHGVDRDERKALVFLRDVARLSLEGGRTSRRFARKDDASEHVDSTPRRIRAAVPERAAVILERLAGVRPPYASLAALRADLAAAADRPAEVGAARRMVQLAIQAFLLSPGLLVITALSCPKLRPGVIPWDLQLVIAAPLLWVLWAILMRGGLSFPLAGLSVVGGDGRVANRLTCGLRALLVWAPAVGVFAGSRYLQYRSPDAVMLAWSSWIAGVLLLIVFVMTALWLPSRGPHDRLSGTVVVPI